MELIQHTIVSFLLWVCFSVQAQAPLVLRYAEQMQHIDPNVVVPIPIHSWDSIL